MKTRAKKIEEVLFGRCNLEGGLHVRGNMSFPKIDGGQKEVYWRGNEGLIIHLIERIEKLEEIVAKQKSK